MRTLCKIILKNAIPMIIGFLIAGYLLIVMMNLDYRGLLPIFG